MRASTIQTSREWINRNVNDENTRSAICLTFPTYLEYIHERIKVEAKRQKKSKVMVIRDAVMTYIREQERIRKENEELRGDYLWTI